jgi:pimeloyl-ACP methyl ester carboxylesterase
VTDAIIYLHGGPGSPDECALFDEGRLHPDYAPDRFAAFGGVDAADVFDRLADDIANRFADRTLHLIGFSMGGYATLELAHRLGGRVARIDLVATAAPLEGGAFLDKMAGRTLFAIAQRRPGWLSLVMAVQRVLVRATPSLAYHMLYSNARGADRMLVADPMFKARIVAILKHCYGAGGEGFSRELMAYVRPWAHILALIGAPVTIWHGDEDNWAPFAMAEYLVEAIPNATLRRIQGASHYSALHEAFSQITRSPS